MFLKVEVCIGWQLSRNPRQFKSMAATRCRARSLYYKLDASLAVASLITSSPGLGIGVDVLQAGHVVLPAVEDANDGYRVGVHGEGNHGSFLVMGNA